MELFQQIFFSLLHWDVFLILCTGIIAGIAIGALPGLTATMGVALLLPVTFSMEPVTGILLLVGIYFGGIYGGSITAILLRTPGTPAAAATAIDGYAMSQKGLAHKALTISTLSSAIGGVLSVIILILVAPVLANFALNFSAPEMFALAVFGLTVISTLLDSSIVKGIFATMIGLLISTIGMDPVGAFPRFTFNSMNLMSGVGLIPVLIGLFAASQAFKLMEDIFSKEKIVKVNNNIKLKWNEFRKLLVTIFRSTGIGAFTGMVPGAGGDLAAFIAYNEAKRYSKNPEEFGKGKMEGVAAPEAANNGSTGGAMIPLLTLGIPGDAVTAVMLGALIVQGLQPGPMLFQQHGELVQTLFAGMIVANLLLLCFGLVGIRLFVKILAVPKVVLIPIIFVLCIVGSYALGNNLFDVWVMFIAGVVGYFMQRYGFPASPVILALILGPMMEENLRRSLVMSHGSLEIFFTRPITVSLLILALISLLTPFIRNWLQNRRLERDRT